MVKLQWENLSKNRKRKKIVVRELLTIEEVPWGNYRWDITASGKLPRKFTIKEQKERNGKKWSKKYCWRISHHRGGNVG
jgi:hypothetical protein